MLCNNPTLYPVKASWQWRRQVMCITTATTDCQLSLHLYLNYKIATNFINTQEIAHHSFTYMNRFILSNSIRTWINFCFISVLQRCNDMKESPFKDFRG